MFDGTHHADEHMAHRDDPPHPPLAGRRLRRRPADHHDRRTRARSGSSSWSTRTAPNTTSPAASSTTGARTASRRPGTTLDRHGPQPQLRLPLGRRRPDQREPGGHHLPRDRRAFSTPEDRAMRDFLASRVVDGRQQIRTAITFHENGRLVMWPYGYTMTDVPGRHDHRRTTPRWPLIGRHMAATNGYKPEQASDLYISSGTIARLPVRRLPDLRLHLRDVGRGLSGRLADRVRDRAEQGGRAVPDGARLVPAGGARRARSGPPAAAPSTTTSRSTAAGRVNPDGTDTAPASGRLRPRQPGVDVEPRPEAARDDAVRARRRSSPARRPAPRPSANDLDGRTTIRSPAIVLPAAAGPAPDVRLRLRPQRRVQSRPTCCARSSSWPTARGCRSSRWSAALPTSTAPGGPRRSRWTRSPGRPSVCGSRPSTAGAGNLLEVELDDIRVTRPG